MQRVYRIDAVDIHLLKSKPVSIGITAKGTVASTGWTDPQLAARFYLVPPADGIQDFDFYAQEPSGIVLPVLTPISAVTVVERDPANYWGEGKPLVGVRVHAAENAIEALLEKASPLEIHLSTGGDNDGMWPWLSGKAVSPSLASSISTLIGKSLRVYRTGDALTKDYREDRANIELNRTDHRIVSIWIG